MAKSMHIEDQPNFDTYPGPESPQTNTAAYIPGRQSAETDGEGLADRAGQVAESARQTARDAAHDARERLQVIRGRGVQMTQAAAKKVGEMKCLAEERLTELRSRAAERLHLARNRAERVSRQHPLEVILGAFAVAFAMGMALRIWRSSRD